MSRKYFYKLPYSEKDPNISYRRCKTCSKMCKIKQLENSFTCKKCYIKKHNKKRCNKCYLLKPIGEFFKNCNTYDGYKNKCKSCQENSKGSKNSRKLYKKWSSNENRIAFYNARTRSRKLKSSFKEYEEEIKEIYNNCPKGYEIDHIHPLNHPNVCGLHVPWNLQYLPYEESLKKSNNFDGTVDNLSWKS